MKKSNIFKTLKLVLVIILLIAPLSNAISSGDSGVAVVKKAVNNVIKESSGGKIERAEKSPSLFSNDKLITGRKAFALVKFVEDNSILRIREQSILTIKADGPRNSSLKEAFLDKGSVGFDITKQQNNQQFQLTSPTSVASIRGTKGKWCRSEHSDTLILIEGRVVLKNRLSNNEIEIEAGFIGISNEDGTIEKRAATEEELKNADRFASSDDIRRQLKIEMRDPRGNNKTLKLDYKE
ncbi:MAG: FecR domain-containing protein [Ignavibacteriales bacterium]|nr:FecR domain-containing protein [Ignavibacteriales bacterium]